MTTLSPPPDEKQEHHDIDTSARETTTTSSDDVEKQKPMIPTTTATTAPGDAAAAEGQRQDHDNVPAFKSLSFLDRFLAIWIFLAMLVGILLGNFVKDVGPALQKGTFVEVSVPIGKHLPAHPPTYLPNITSSS